MRTETTFYVHATAVKYFDYRTLLEVEHGVSFSMTGLACDARNFEPGVTVADKLALMSEAPKGVLVVQGEPVTRKRNMNPHGLI